MHTSTLALLTGGSLLRGSLALSLAVPTGLTVGPRPALAMTAASEEEPPPVDAQASSDSNELPAGASVRVRF